jgi:hypothetical protein
MAQMPKGRIRFCFLAGCCGVLLWACVWQLLSLGLLWCCSWTPSDNSPAATLAPISLFSGFGGSRSRLSDSEEIFDSSGHDATLPPPSMLFTMKLLSYFFLLLTRVIVYCHVKWNRIGNWMDYDCICLGILLGWIMKFL